MGGKKLLLNGGRKALPFIITVKTDNPGTSADNQFFIKLQGTGNLYDVSTSDGQTINGNTVNLTITFPAAGTYDISISGIFKGLKFENGGDKLKLLEIKQWGDTSMDMVQDGGYYGCENLFSVANDIEYLNLITSAFSMFRNCYNLRSMPTELTLPFLDYGFAMFFNSSLINAFPSLSLNSLTNGFAMFGGLTINTTDYSNMINRIDANNANTGVNFHGGSSKYNASAVTAHDNLTVTKSWTITDGGLI